MNRRTRLTTARIEDALRKAGGVKTLAADLLKINRATIYRWLERHPDLAEAVEDIDEETKDLAEGKLVELLRAGDPTTVRWYLETKAKDRGYSRRVENVGKDGGPIQTRRDLSGYTDDELAAMIAIEAAKAGREGKVMGNGLHRHGNHSCDCAQCAPHLAAKEAA